MPSSEERRASGKKGGQVRNWNAFMREHAGDGPREFVEKLAVQKLGYMVIQKAGEPTQVIDMKNTVADGVTEADVMGTWVEQTAETETPPSNITDITQGYEQHLMAQQEPPADYPPHHPDPVSAPPAETPKIMPENMPATPVTLKEWLESYKSEGYDPATAMELAKDEVARQQVKTPANPGQIATPENPLEVQGPDPAIVAAHAEKVRQMVQLPTTKDLTEEYDSLEVSIEDWQLFEGWRRVYDADMKRNPSSAGCTFANMFSKLVSEYKYSTKGRMITPGGVDGLAEFWKPDNTYKV